LGLSTINTNSLDWLSSWFASRNPDIAKLKSNVNYLNAELIDSYDLVELIESIERTFQITFNQDDFESDRFYTIEGLSALIDKKIKNVQ